MDTIDQIFVEGEWVQIVSCRLSGFSGYIVRYDPEDRTYKIMITRDPSGKPFKKNQWINEEYIAAEKNARDEDSLYTLIDLTLDMGDKEWFLELTAQIPEELPF